MSSDSTPPEPTPTASPTSAIDATREAIVEEEGRLAQLDIERSALLVRLERLRAALRSSSAESGSRVDAPSLAKMPLPKTAAEKVKLFRSLFRGRDDVYPTRFVSTRTGKSGYAPACRNKFVAGVCELPKIKCGDCPNQAFAPVDDSAVVAHLTGRHVMGVYPLLADETCWFLAVDFDKASWADDVRGFVQTCRQVGVPVAIERSRSGNGAHAWFFFSAPVAASTARKMGCHLLTETMARRHELSMESYDRLFPSQDTMPRGGFGNLIALPLQHEPRKQGNSVFLDDRLAPIPDAQQWAYLASVARIEPDAVERIAREAMRDGSVVGLRAAEALDAADTVPWTRQPSGSRRSSASPIPGPLPSKFRAVLAQKLFVEKAGLPSALLNQIKRVAAFQNPEFFKKQAMRLSTASTPRVISCAEDLPQHVGLPRGCREAVEVLLRDHGIVLEVDDQRVSGQPLELRFHGTLTATQQQAVTALLGSDIGVFVAPPGVGKTVVGTRLVAERGCSTLVLVHRRPLLDQWRAQLSLFLGIEAKEIGHIGAGKNAGNGRLDVAMIQSLVRKGVVNDVVASYGQVIVDECHHVSAVSFERVLAEVKARYVVGLTATPQRRDGHDPIVEMQLGPVRFTVDPKSEAARRPFVHRLVVRETGFDMSGTAPERIQDLYALLAADEKRNQLILGDVVQALEGGRSPLLLTERRDHLVYFAERLARVAQHMVVLHGGMNAKERREATAQLSAIPANEERVVLASGRYVGEGFDDARLDTLFLALPVAWKGTLIQYAGRLHRDRLGKSEVRIFDYVDRDLPVLLRMFEKRLRGYRAIGYARDEAPLDCIGEATEQEVVIEYDEDVVREPPQPDEFA